MSALAQVRFAEGINYGSVIFLEPRLFRYFKFQVLSFNPKYLVNFKQKSDKLSSFPSLPSVQSRNVPGRESVYDRQAIPLIKAQYQPLCQSP